MTATTDYSCGKVPKNETAFPPVEPWTASETEQRIQHTSENVYVVHNGIMTNTPYKYSYLVTLHVVSCFKDGACSSSNMLQT